MPKDFAWVSTCIESSFAADASAQVILLDDMDWIAGSGFERATLTAIRGFLSFYPNGVGAGSLFLAILKCGDAEGPIDVASTAAYNENDILWCGGATGRATAESFQTIRHELNIKTKRIITANDEIRLGLHPAGAPFYVAGTMRCLVEMSRH